MTNSESATARWRVPSLVWLLPLAVALYSIWIGRDANWDLLNYHYYNVYAWLEGRETVDVAFGQLQTLFNPLLQLPFYFGVEYLPPRLYAGLMGFVQGLNLVLVWSIAKAAWPAGSRLALGGPVLVAIAAGTGAAFLTEVGTSFGDTLVSLPIFAALRLIVAAHANPARATGFVVAAGVLGGVAVGLKPLAGLYAIALAASLVSLPATLGTRATRLVLLGLGGIAGAGVSAGWWYWDVWRMTGNPLFPYYNDIFQSPLYWPERFVFGYFLPKTWIDTVFYPWIWLFNPTRVSEMRFVNLAIPGLATFAAALTAARVLGLQPRGDRSSSPLVRALVAFWIVAYVLWLTQSSVYRFAVVLESLAPLLIVALLARWVPPAMQVSRIVLVLIPIIVLTRPANFGRYAFTDDYMDMPRVAVPNNTMVAVAGWSPLSYTAIAFPKEVPFVRIQSNMHGFADRPNGTDALVRARLAQHTGPIRLLLAEPEWSIAQPLLDHYGYKVNKSECEVIDGTLAGGGGAGRLQLCPMQVR